MSELINIAFGLTAAKLSEIAGHRVRLEPPRVGIHPMRTLTRELRLFSEGPAVAVHQVFGGPIAGDAILFLNYESAVKLSNLIVDEHLRSQRLDPTTKEILTEVGNMLLGASLGVLGNLLEVRVSFSVPQLRLDSVDHFLNALAGNGGESRQAIVVTASFNIREQAVEGRFVIVLGVSSLERMIQAVERWEGSQVSA